MTGVSSIPLAQEQGSDQDALRKFKGTARILGPRWANLPTITVGLLGVQIFWSVEMSYASPYLLTLGLSKSSMAVVFVAGPLSGLIMQPLIGILADSSTSRFGRRRPYMILGTVLCMVAMLLLGFTRPVASIFTSKGSDANNSLTIWLAILAIYLIDFGINAVQAVDRALLVDTVPPAEQASGNAWAARMLGVGSVVGFFVGNIDLTHAFPFLGKTQLEVLAVIVSLMLLAGHLTMALLVKERVLLKQENLNSKISRTAAFLQELKEIWSNILVLPWVIRQICLVQFFAWIAWFPVLFYSTLYVGDLHKRSSPIPTTDEARGLLDAEATRLGSRALFFSSVIALAANIILPAFVPEVRQGQAPDREYDHTTFWHRFTKIPKVFQIHLAALWALSHLIFACCMFSTFFVKTVWGATILVTVTGLSWAIVQWAPFSLLAQAILTEPGPTTLDDGGSIRLADTRTRDSERERFLETQDEESEDDDDVRKGKAARLAFLGNAEAQVSSLNVHEDTRNNHSDDDYELVESHRFLPPPQADVDDPDLDQSNAARGSLSSKAGIIIGIHNMFIVVPQFLVTGISSVVFAIFDPQKTVMPKEHPLVNGTIPASQNLGLKNATDALANTILRRYDILEHITREPSDVKPSQSNSIVYIFRFGGLAAMVAFVLCWRLARALRHR